MEIESRTVVQSRRGQPTQHLITMHDVMGIVTGIPALLAGIWGLAMLGHTMLVDAPEPEYGIIGGISLLISFGLFIPSRFYNHGKARIIGLAALALAAAATTYCAALLGLGAYSFLSDPPENGEMRWIMVAVAMFWCLIAFVLASSGMSVLFKKSRPKRAQAVLALGSGIAAGSAAVVSLLLG